MYLVHRIINTRTHKDVWRYLLEHGISSLTNGQYSDAHNENRNRTSRRDSSLYCIPNVRENMKNRIHPTSGSTSRVILPSIQYGIDSVCLMLRILVQSRLVCSACMRNRFFFLQFYVNNTRRQDRNMPLYISYVIFHLGAF